MKTLFFMLATLLVVHASHAAPQPAYAANTGWINLTPSAEHRVTTHATFLSGWAWSGNLGWIHFGDGSPANGTSYANDSAADFGVNRDGSGFLSGYAYSANAGWIQFGSASLTGDQKSRYQAATDTLSGYAYSANTGWLFLGEAPPPVDDTNLALDTDAAPLAFTGGSGFTTVTGTQAQDGVDALKAASLDANAFTERVLSFSVTGPARVRVWRKLVDPDGHGNFVMQLNGASLFSTSAFGTNEWAQVMLPVPRGTHMVSLVAASYAYGTSTPPQILLDQLTVTPEVVPLSEFITSPPAGGFRQPYGSPIFMSVQTMANRAFTFQWRKDGTDLPGRTMPNLEIFNFQAANAGYYTVRVSDGVDTWESLPILQAPFVSSDPWFTQTSVDRDGGGAWQSGATPHWGESQRNESLNGVGTLRFWWKVSSESGKDFLRFNWNGHVSSISGEQDWQLVERVVNHGDPLFNFAVWTYAKDGAVTAGSDAAWVDGIEFISGNAAPQISSAAPSGDVPYGLWTHQVSVTDADDTAFTFSLLNAPSGMSISSSGLITWNTTDAGTSSGTVTIRAADGGENNAPAATQTFSVAVVPRSVTWTFSNLLQTYDGSAKSVTVTSDPPGVAASLTYNGSATAPVNAGDYTASAAPTNANYTGTSSATLTIQKAAQTITFPSIAAKTTLSSPFAHQATSSSGLAVSVSSSDTAVATVSGPQVIITGAGSTTLTATQAGDANHFAASSVQRVLSVTTATVSPLEADLLLVNPSTVTQLGTDYATDVSLHGDHAALCMVKGNSTLQSTLSVWKRTGGDWSLLQTLPRGFPDWDLNADFGAYASKVRIFGDTMAVTYHGDFWTPDSPNMPLERDLRSLTRVAMYQRNTTSGLWEYHSELIAKVEPYVFGERDYEFGSQIALHGDVCAVAAIGRRMVFVFEREGGAWQHRATLTPHGGHPSMSWGHRIALDGKRILVGSPRNGRGVSSGEGFPPSEANGFVEVWDRVAAGQWQRSAVIHSPEPASNGWQFGEGVAIDGTQLAVGDPLFSPQVHDGTVFVYRETAPGVWTQDDAFHGSTVPLGIRPLPYGRHLAFDLGKLISAYPTQAGNGASGTVIEVRERQPDGTWPPSHRLSSGYEAPTSPYTAIPAQSDAIGQGITEADIHQINALGAHHGSYVASMVAFFAPPSAQRYHSAVGLMTSLPSTPSNSPPESITLTGTQTWPANVVHNAPLGSFSSYDPDGGPLTHTLTSGAGDTDNALFSIVGAELRVANAAALAAKTFAFIRVRVTDAGGLFHESLFMLRNASPYTIWAVGAGGAHGRFLDPIAAAPDADPDGNGVANLLEFAANDDQLAQNGGQMLFGGDPAPRLFMDFDFDDVRAGQITLAGEGSDDLITWTPVTLQIVSQSGGRRVVRLIDSVTSQTHTRRFIRLRAGL